MQTYRFIVINSVAVNFFFVYGRANFIALYAERGLLRLS